MTRQDNQSISPDVQEAIDEIMGLSDDELIAAAWTKHAKKGHVFVSLLHKHLNLKVIDAVQRLIAKGILKERG